MIKKWQQHQIDDNCFRDIDLSGPSHLIECSPRDSIHNKGYKCKKGVTSKSGNRLYKKMIKRDKYIDDIRYDYFCDRFRSCDGRFVSRKCFFDKFEDIVLVNGYYDSGCKCFRSGDGRFISKSKFKLSKDEMIKRDSIFKQAGIIDSRILEEKNQVKVGEKFPAIDFYSKEPEYIVLEISIDRLIHIMSRDKESIWLLSDSDRMVLMDELRELFGKRIKLSFNIRTGDICLMGYDHNDVLWYKIDEILNKEREGKINIY